MSERLVQGPHTTLKEGGGCSFHSMSPRDVPTFHTKKKGAGSICEAINQNNTHLWRYSNSKTGTTKAMVLPEPVRAAPRMSRPARAWGIVAC